jgi:hypothetical protein
MPTLIHQLAIYSTSKDYEWLANTAKEKSIICIIDYRINRANEDEYILRDVGSTNYFEKDNGHGMWSISCRGTGYLTAFNKDEFIKLCDFLNVEFIKP